MNDTRQPTLQDDLVMIRPLKQNDFHALYHVASDPLIWEQHPAKERATTQGFRTFFTDAMNSEGALVIVDQKTENIIGSSRYQSLIEKRDAIEIGWTFLARKYWGGVYNASIKKLMIEHASKYFNEIVFFVDVENIRSQKAVLKLGAIELNPENHRYVKGHSGKYYTYSIHREKRS